MMNEIGEKISGPHPASLKEIKNFDIYFLP